MQTIEQRFRYQKLELIAPKPSLKTRIAALISALSESLLSLGSASQEPQITQIRDRAGQMGWRVYDPVSGQVNRFASEDAVRTWLESRYR